MDLPLPDRTRRYRSIWISDIHLGTRVCRADLLLDFLRRTDSDFLYLVGDVVDGLELQKSWYWPQAHNDIIQKILRKARKGTEVTYIVGNHDAGARLFANVTFGGVLVRKHVLHRSAAGALLWVTHGNRFDAAIKFSRLLSLVGGWAYDLANAANVTIDWLRRGLRLPPWSLAAEVKRRSRRIEAYLAAYEQAAVDEARRRGVDGIVCGHIHTAALKTIDGILYCNDGDWVENGSALVEHHDGRLELLHWQRAGVPAERPATSHAGAALPVGAS